MFTEGDEHTSVCLCGAGTTTNRSNPATELMQEVLDEQNQSLTLHNICTDDTQECKEATDDVITDAFISNQHNNHDD